jgi:hypothetical protein
MYIPYAVLKRQVGQVLELAILSLVGVRLILFPGKYLSIDRLISWLFFK